MRRHSVDFACNESRCQDAGIETSSENVTDVPLFVEEQDCLHGILFLRRESTHQQKTIEIRKPQFPFADPPFVDTPADGRNSRCIPEFRECAVTAAAEQLTDPLIAGVVAHL